MGSHFPLVPTAVTTSSNNPKAPDLSKGDLRLWGASHSSSFWMVNNRVKPCLGLSQVALPGLGFGVWGGKERWRHFKTSPETRLSLNQWLTGLMDQMSAQHLPESRHLTPTERLQRNCSSMALYYEKILGAPPLDLPETLWKWPDANLVF